MYEELVKMLRVCGDSNNSCGNCPAREDDGSCPHGDWEFAAEKYMLQAADAIEELSKQLKKREDMLRAEWDVTCDPEYRESHFEKDEWGE